MTPKQKRIISIIKAIRESFGDAKAIYTCGACYGFYKILKSIYPEAVGYLEEDGNHIMTKIGGDFYDIYGFAETHNSKAKDKPMTDREHVYWDSNVYAWRAEGMIKRYNKS